LIRVDGKLPWADKIYIRAKEPTHGAIFFPSVATWEKTCSEIEQGIAATNTTPHRLELITSFKKGPVWTREIGKSNAQKLKQQRIPIIDLTDTILVQYPPVRAPTNSMFVLGYTFIDDGFVQINYVTSRDIVADDGWINTQREIIKGWVIEFLKVNNEWPVILQKSSMGYH